MAPNTLSGVPEMQDTPPCRLSAVYKPSDFSGGFFYFQLYAFIVPLFFPSRSNCDKWSRFSFDFNEHKRIIDPLKVYGILSFFIVKISLFIVTRQYNVL